MVAAALHGSARLTQDVDAVYRRTSEDIGRLTGALAKHQPHFAGLEATGEFSDENGT